MAAKDLIESVLSTPSVGAVISEKAEELCLKNNLNFVSLIRPFSKISTEGTVHFLSSNYS